MLKPMREVYGDDQSDYGCWYDYKPMGDSFGEILIWKKSNDYQGDTFAIIYEKENDRYGTLTFGWGSCSGCDALQGCSTIEDLDQLASALYSSIVWYPNKEQLTTWMLYHDWEGDFSWGMIDELSKEAFIYECLVGLYAPQKEARNHETPSHKILC